ncbi:MAG: DNA-directed RNA polymerase subunit P [Nanoarchaeota archaeon]
MTSYECVNCGKEVQGILVERKVRCPFCSTKVLRKVQKAPQMVKAR